MTTAYDQAVEALYQAPHASFVGKRRGLAAELKAGGDKAAATRLSKLPRPSVSAWAVNQLWWHARSAFDELFETAEQVRSGKAPAAGAHRRAVSKLTTRAKQLLIEHEHGGSEAILRRITMTLSALAASGSWTPEQPGMLAKDLDPPGFEAFGIATATPAEPKSEPEAPSKASKKADAKAKQQAAAQALRARELERKAAAAEEKRLAERRIQHAAKKLELESALRAAKTALTTREHERDRAAKALKAAEQEVARARAQVEAAEEQLTDHSTG